MASKHEVAAFLIMENTMEPSKPQNLQVHDKNGLFFVRFNTTLQAFDTFNRNRRKYASRPMMESLQAPHIQELLRMKTWLGEAGHPLSEDPKRVLTIDPKLTSHRINNFHLQGSLLKGEVETLDDGKFGTQMTKNILQGMEPAFSLRALAPLIKQADGTVLIQSKAHIVTYDWVILPSHKEAYRDSATPVQKIVKSIQADGNTVNESLIPVIESQIADYIKMESANVKVVSNICEVALESMQLSSDLKHVILREGNQTFVVKVEDRIKQDVRRFMANM